MMHTDQKRQRQTETRHWVEKRHEDFGQRWGRGGKGEDEGQGEVGDGATKQQRPGRSFECTLASSSSSSSTNRRIKYTLLIPLIQT